MREKYVTEIVKEVLGPRNGIHEEIKEYPLKEYITGILAPLDSDGEIDIDDDAASLAEGPETSEDDTHESDMLNPKKKPSSMGLSFTVRTKDELNMSVCVTWAKYEFLEKNKLWRRYPKFFLQDVRGDNSRKFLIGSNGNLVKDPHDAEIILDVIIKKDSDYFVSLFLVNKLSGSSDNQPIVEHHIFQPQIRVKFTGGTQIVQGGHYVSPDPDERQLEFLYRDKTVLARGHLCSAVWNQIDPERPHEKIQLDFPDAEKQIPFTWADGELLENPLKEFFTAPDVRTEFVPMYAISAPNLQWNKSLYGPSPELKAESLAELYDSQKLRDALIPLQAGYRAWISQLEYQSSKLDIESQKIAEKLIDDSKAILERIKSGIETVINNEEAKLAFCFANKALDIQAKWSRKRPLVWYPFQLAFILINVEPIVNQKSINRDVCDLLWVPTGAGKTEAYLAIVAFSLAYRRRRALMRRGLTEDRTGAGVSTISRYTLRLLTIQQFRRTLSVITACEFLRVYNFTSKSHIGWRPSASNSGENMIWGSTPFSAGLWVGGSVTPNRLVDSGQPAEGIPPGALELLKQETKEVGEPAQITECPACATLLSIPEMGLQEGAHDLHFIIQCKDYLGKENQIKTLEGQTLHNIKITNSLCTPMGSRSYYTLSLKIETGNPAKSADIDSFWERVHKQLATGGLDAQLISARASRMGYFIRYYLDRRNMKKEFDFEVFCPNPKCPLHVSWAGGMPQGWIYGIQEEQLIPESKLLDMPLPDGNVLIMVQEPFQDGSGYISDRIPIPSLTVDDQIYNRLPSVVVATVDKFARPPFESRAAGLFGNVNYHSSIGGYYRTDQSGRSMPPSSDSGIKIKPLDPPDLILQDELHLIDGPLGSLVGIYETAVEQLIREKGSTVKYIASTATIHRARDQVLSIFQKEVQTFPPPGLDADNRFFITDIDIHPLSDLQAGRLYVGICAPSRGGLTPIVRIFSSLLQTAWEVRTLPNNDGFWTLTGYFNSVRELAGARALYRQDIPLHLNEKFKKGARQITDDKAVELSSRTSSTDLPGILNLLSRPAPSSPDILFTTSMFGTGVDIGRLALMVVDGQPKTTSSYVQATGRVGRTSGGLVITFFRASRPRDLSHYEFFGGYHRQLHRFVEPVTVFPFSPGALARAAGPVSVFILRNMSNPTLPWYQKDTARAMGSNRNSANEVKCLPDIFESRAQHQPSLRRPVKDSVKNFIGGELDRWSNYANSNQDLEYFEYFRQKHSVVLGDPEHKHSPNLHSVYSDAPQSLRDIEETTSFQTE